MNLGKSEEQLPLKTVRQRLADCRPTVNRLTADGGKESQFSSLPFGQAVASMY